MCACRNFHRGGGKPKKAPPPPPHIKTKIKAPTMEKNVAKKTPIWRKSSKQKKSLIFKGRGRLAHAPIEIW